MTDVTALRIAMLTNGYEPIPCIGKAPVVSNWPSITIDEAAIRNWMHERPRATNTGARTKLTATVDVDIKDAAAAEAVETLVRERFGNGGGRLLRRIGEAPKRAFPFRTDAPFEKLQQNFIAPDGSKHKIEILANGQQFVVDGTHPDTHLPYAWTGGNPWTVPRGDLPQLNAADARSLLADATVRLVGLGWRKAEPDRPKADNVGAGGDLPLIVALAQKVWGQGTFTQSGYRFGAHGSKLVDAAARQWFDFEANIGGGLRDLMALVTEKTSTEEIKPIPLIDLSRWDDEPVPAQEWAVQDRIPLNQTTLFSGQGAAGKSTLQLQLSAATVLRRDWLGTTAKGGPALFIDAEDDEAVIHKRLADILRYYGVRFEDVKGKLHIASLTGEDAVLGALSRKNSKIEPTPLYNKLYEMVGDLKPTMIGIASAADVFAGSEIDRSQVQQFISLLTKLARLSNGSLVLIAHPSLTGIGTDTGLSGSTQWHNSVRARLYLKGMRTEEGEQPDTNLREIEFKKNNYGPLTVSIPLRYENGLFLPITGTTFDQAAREERADEIFLTVLRALIGQNQDLGPNKNASNYAPTVIAGHPIASGYRKTELEAAQQRLLDRNQIHIKSVGPPSRSRKYIAVGPRPPTNGDEGIM